MVAFSSCLYECLVTHTRKSKTATSFYYRYFMWYLDLDEIDSIAGKLWLFSRNKFNMYSFRDSDHISTDGKTVRQGIENYLHSQGIEAGALRIYLLTNVRTLGYNFNPVSFYFCFDQASNPVCVIPEVGNTFGELKPFFIDSSKFDGKQFHHRLPKYFYVSPFIEHDVKFDFRLSVPDAKLDIRIDDYQEDQRIFITTLTGKRISLQDKALAWFSIKYPLVTLKVIIAIHIQALKLLYKGLPYFRKNELTHLQQGAINKWKRHSN